MDRLKLEISISKSTTAPPIALDHEQVAELVVAMADAIAIVHRAPKDVDDDHHE